MNFLFFLSEKKWNDSKIEEMTDVKFNLTFKQLSRAITLRTCGSIHELWLRTWLCQTCTG